MVSVSASDFKNVMHITDSDTNMEYVLDMAINTLNLFGAEAIDNMSGDAGSKTVTLTSKQQGGVFLAAQIIYEQMFKDRGNVGIGGVTVTTADLLANPVVMSTIEKIAKKLSTVNFHVAEDTSGLE